MDDDSLSLYDYDLPRDRIAPEATDNRQGFIHPYHFDGGVGQAVLKLILRDFETPKLADHADLLRGLAAQVEQMFPGVKVGIAITRQYRNMGDGLAQDPRAVEYAERAHKRLGLACQRTIVRGGTDGAVLTEKGLPTPNLSTGQHVPHSRLEWACLDEMVLAAKVLVELVQVWAEPA